MISEGVIYLRDGTVHRLDGPTEVGVWHTHSRWRSRSRSTSSTNEQKIQIVDGALIAVSIFRRFLDPEESLGHFAGRLKDILAILRRVHSVDLTNEPSYLPNSPMQPIRPLSAITDGSKTSPPSSGAIRKSLRRRIF